MKYVMNYIKRKKRRLKDGAIRFWDDETPSIG